MLLHAKHCASANIQMVIIQSLDTDMAVLGISCCGTGALTCKLLFLTGTQHIKCYVNLSAIGEILGNDVCECFLGAHAFTGCDTVSAFHGFGKAKVLKLLMNSNIFCAAMLSWEQPLNLLTSSPNVKRQCVSCMVIHILFYFRNRLFYT